ncbi:biotin transporter BioY [Pontibacillus yanchengensis]|uniref:Biotin transporter BioY n=2 Tax=Pontibacillus yanchengensis TaxID=462910 RepID=A0ACC7VC25_9BACI|nr:biotin transporter BioY [Pontibacillus yanchengensis]MYL35125.1 biotin transporter BioY [Pontibacillus yanchengensis]MYL52508.1 biotin transporter BioY [Pontibacillus yanchengensis]
MELRTMIYASLFAAIVGALGLLPPLITPFTPVPITAQTLGVMLAGSLLGAKKGGLSLLVFVLLVMVGAPLLSGGRGGLGVLFGVSGGYILSWPIGAFVIGYLVERFWSRMNIGLFILANLIGGVIVVYAMGVTYLSIITDTTWGQAAWSALIYIPGDLVKVVVASVIARQMMRVYPLIEKSRSNNVSRAV